MKVNLGTIEIRAKERHAIAVHFGRTQPSALATRKEVVQYLVGDPHARIAELIESQERPQEAEPARPGPVKHSAVPLRRLVKYIASEWDWPAELVATALSEYRRLGGRRNTRNPWVLRFTGWLDNTQRR